MNDVIASIYGTNGHEKVASEDGLPLATLSDLAEALAVENLPEGSDLEKVAHVSGQVLEELEFYDLSGRAAAHAEFTQLEKVAAAGDTTALEAFFEEAEEGGALSEAAHTKQVILEELARRQG